MQPSILVLAGLLVLQKLVRTELYGGSANGANGHTHLPIGPLLGAGALLGLATGLKLTASIYSPAACLALIAVIPLRRWIVWCCVIVLGWLPAFALAAGWWASKLWARFGSPVFPLLNGLFRSSWYPPVSFFDRRFFPQGDWQWLYYPLAWMHMQSDAMELPFRDSRGATVYLLGLVAISIAFVRWTRLLPCVAEVNFWFSKEQKLLLAFLAFSYILWLWTSSILRYAIPIEVVAGLSIPLLVGALSSQLPPSLRKHAWVTASLLTVLVVCTTRYSHFTRAPYSSPVIRADLSRIAPSTMVVFAGDAISYLVPFLPTESRAHLIGVDNTLMEARGFGLYDAVIKRFREHRGSFLLLWDPIQIWMPMILAQAELSLEMNNCQDVDVAIGAAQQPLKACGGHLQPVTKLSSKFWREAAEHYKRIEVHELWPRRWSYPAFALTAGDAAHGIDIIDINQKLWPLPKFGDKIRSDTLYILSTNRAKDLASRIIDPNSDMLSEIDGFLVLAPGWYKIIPRLTGTRGRSLQLAEIGKSSATSHHP